MGAMPVNAWYTVRGQKPALALLQRALEQERVAHAYLFAGPAGVGKRTTARLFAQGLVCTGEERPCGSCAACRRAAHGNHPDIHWIEPDGSSVRIEQVRELRRNAALRPYEARRKVFVLAGADAMTEQAQNALLKTLEEPPGEAVLILIADAPGRLRETILSRTQMVRFGLLGLREVAGVLQANGMGVAEAERLAAVAGGAPGRVLGRPDLAAWQERVAGWVDRLIAQEAAVEQVAAEMETLPAPGPTLDDILDLWLWELRNRVARMIVAPAGDAGEEQCFDCLDDPAAGLLQGIAVIEEARQILGRNANRRLALDVMLVKLRRGFRT